MEFVIHLYDLKSSSSSYILKTSLSSKLSYCRMLAQGRQQNLRQNFQRFNSTTSGKIAISQLSTHGYWSEFSVVACLSTQGLNDGRDGGGIPRTGTLHPRHWFTNLHPRRGCQNNCRNSFLTRQRFSIYVELWMSGSSELVKPISAVMCFT